MASRHNLSEFISLINFRYFSKSQKPKMTSLLVPPVTVRGMKKLDRDLFTTTIEIPCFNLVSVKLSDVTRTLKKYILKLKNLKPIQTTGSSTIVYLDPKKVQTFDDFSSEDAKILKNYVSELSKTQLTLKYENWQSDEILKAVLPEEIEIPTSYSKVGHIIHLNLRDSQLQWKNLIGEVFLDNIAHARTVVNKLNTIDTTYRHFAMEVLAGEKDTVATVKENGFTYQFDFAAVYWNPRLSTEHANLLTFMAKGDVLYDVFAGVGPFAIPAARKGVKVLANDLNPESYKWLENNAKLNKIKNLKAYNEDGRDFLRNIVRPDIIERRDKNSPGVEHVAMNLPALAYQFLDVFYNWLGDEDAVRICEKRPMIHLYCFVKTDNGGEPAELARKLVEDKIGAPLMSESLKDVHHVRNVSPNKEMMRVSFYLVESMIRNVEGEPARKKTKVYDYPELLIGGDVIGDDEAVQRKDE